jgi:PhnB protein
MASRLNPYINFTDNARQAMEFYQSVFGGKLTLDTFANFVEPDSPMVNLIMHGMLETEHGFTIMAADLPPGMSRVPGNNVTVALSGDDAEELRGYWAKLSEHGTVSTPLEKQMWGDEFGSCEDQFGIGWLVDITAPQS